jgi:hypothetical protein
MQYSSKTRTCNSDVRIDTNKTFVIDCYEAYLKTRLQNSWCKLVAPPVQDVAIGTATMRGISNWFDKQVAPAWMYVYFDQSVYIKNMHPKKTEGN